MTEMKQAAPAKPAPAAKRRPSKPALRRAKLAAIAVSVVAFVGTLAGVSRTGAPTSQAALAAAPAAAIAPSPIRQQRNLGTDLQAPTKPSPFVMPAVPQAPTMQLRPFGRTRGS